MYDIFKLISQYILYIVGISISKMNFHSWYPTIMLNFSVGSSILSCYPSGMYFRDATGIKSIEKNIAVHAGLGPKLIIDSLSKMFVPRVTKARRRRLKGRMIRTESQ